jgi:hypothetical protein
MAIFNSYVKLPEGTLSDTPIWAHSIIPCVPQTMVSSEDYLRCMFLSQRDFKGAGRNDTAFMLDQVYLRFGYGFCIRCATLGQEEHT